MLTLSALPLKKCWQQTKEIIQIFKTQNVREANNKNYLGHFPLQLEQRAPRTCFRLGKTGVRILKLRVLAALSVCVPAQGNAAGTVTETAICCSSSKAFPKELEILSLRIGDSFPKKCLLPRDRSCRISWFQVDLSVPAALCCQESPLEVWEVPVPPDQSEICEFSDPAGWRMGTGGTGISLPGKCLQGWKAPRNTAHELLYHHLTLNQLLSEYEPTLGLRWKMSNKKTLFLPHFFSCLMHTLLFKRTKSLTC